MRTGRPLKKLDMDRVKELFLNDNTFREISQVVGLCHTTIYRRINKERKALGLNSTEEYKLYLKSTMKPKIQEIRIVRTPEFTKYIEVGKRISIRYNKPRFARY